MAASSFRRRVKFSTRTTSRNSLGARGETLTEIGTFGANIRSIPIPERVDQGLDSGVQQIIVDVRYSPSLEMVDKSSVMTVGGTEFDIITIDQGSYAFRSRRFYGKERRI